MHSVSTDSPDFFEAAGLGVQPTGVRQANLRAVLTLIALNSGLSAAELARRSHLAPQTISAIIDELDKLGLLTRGEVLRGRRGQPATPYFINVDGAFAVGIEIGWRHIEARLVNMGAQTIAEYHRDYAFPNPDVIFGEIRQIVDRMRDKLSTDQQAKLVGIGVAAPSGIARNLALLESDLDVARRWQALDIKTEIEQECGLHTQVYNDGNAACWAELVSLPQPRPSNFAYLLVGTFIAAGVVAEGVLWQGATGNSADLGSMLITDRHGDLNFAHLVATNFALSQRLIGAGIKLPNSPLDWPWESLEPHVSEWIADAGPAIARVIANTSAVFEFPLAVVDGVLPPHILDRLIKAVAQNLRGLPSVAFDIPKVEKGKLGRSAPSTGAAYLPLYRRFFSRDLTHIAD